MQDTSLPADLRDWVTNHLGDGDLSAVTDVSWSRSDSAARSRVWHVTTGQAMAYLKVSPSVRDYGREVHGYGFAARALAGHQAPRLLAADPDLRAILTSPLPGRIVRGLPLAADEEPRLHELAGRLLRRWHDHSEPVTDQQRQAIMASVADQADEAAACLERTAGSLTGGQRALVQRVRWELPDLAEDLPLAYRHGDYNTRNWLWHPDHGHGLIDFEMSAPGIAVEDLVWLSAAVWANRADLKAAFLAGYARRFSTAEARALPLLAARLAVSYLATGLTQHDHALIERGQRVLAELERDQERDPG
jgi:aminoglycoside/choline kinase family phosphotransferase